MIHTTSSITARYLERFQCIGPSCEESCCIGWQVPVDEGSYRKLKKAMSDSRTERTEFRTVYLPVLPADRNPSLYARIKLLDNGVCSLLDSDKYCSAQRRYGETVLSNTCANYPRMLSVAGPRLEMFATLSCPEAARLALLHEDAFEFVDFKPKPDLRMTLRNAMAPNSPDPYERYFDDVRLTLLRLLSQSKYPLASRTLFVRNFAQLCAPFYYRGCSPVDESTLAQILGGIATPELLDEWHQSRTTVDPSTETAHFLVELLQERLRGTSATSLHRLFSDITQEGKRDSAELIDLYHRRRQRWETAFGDRIDLYFTNYSRNYWLLEWFTHSPNLTAHADKLLLRIALLRFLLFCHPRLEETETREALDAAVVETVQRFSRAIEHQRNFVSRLHQALEESGMDKLAPLLLSL